jgi:hypothetical protein
MFAISHPHFYASMVEWSEALGGVAILLHVADRELVQKPSPHIKFWRGDTRTGISRQHGASPARWAKKRRHFVSGRCNAGGGGSAARYVHV